MLASNSYTQQQVTLKGLCRCITQEPRCRVPILTPSHSDMTVVSKSGRRLCIDLFEELWGGFSDTACVAFRVRVAAIRYQKPVGAGKPPFSGDQRTVFSPTVNMLADHCHDDLFGFD